jgi:polynucleotide 5'-hydroxyl-kinase GRC3/NOL9
MLSAIAARKARLQHPSPSPNASTKRRHSHTPGANPSAKKARKATSKPHSEQKNDLSTTVSKEENAVSLDYSDDDSNMSMTLDQEEPTPVGPSLRERMTYSPSRPVVPLADSSDYASDASESEQPVTDLSQLFPYNRPFPIEEPHILSTYRPIHGQNLFRLSLDEGSALGLSGPAITLVLSPSATVSFVGAYRLRILRGSISLLGTIIPPSRFLHRVFAPRSSPIPVIEALATHGESSKSLYDIPTRIASAIDKGDVIIVLQELRTGIEGLGRVMRTFEGVFHHADPVGASDIPLGGVHFVCFLVLRGRLIRSRRISGIPSRPWYAYLSGTTILGGYILYGTISLCRRGSGPP